MTLIEILISLAVFAVLSTSVSMVLTVTLRAANRAAVVSRIRSDGTYIMDSMATMLRFARNIESCGGNQVVAAVSGASNNVTYSCFPDDETGYIASDSARLSSQNVIVETCTITCLNNETEVSIDFSLKDVDGVITSPINFNSQVVLRNF